MSEGSIGHSGLGCQLWRKCLLSSVFLSHSPPGVGRKVTSEELMLMFQAISRNSGASQKKAELPARMSQKKQRHVESMPHEQAQKMAHFFYYFKLDLICYCGHPARMGRSGSVFLEHPLPPRFCEHPTQSIQVEPLVSCPLRWEATLLFICHFSNLGGWRLYHLLGELCHGSLFSLEPYYLPRGLSGRCRTVHYQGHRSPSLQSLEEASGFFSDFLH